MRPGLIPIGPGMPSGHEDRQPPFPSAPRGPAWNPGQQRVVRLHELCKIAIAREYPQLVYWAQYPLLCVHRIPAAVVFTHGSGTRRQCDFRHESDARTGCGKGSYRRLGLGEGALSGTMPLSPQKGMSELSPLDRFFKWAFIVGRGSIRSGVLTPITEASA
jgi:hypothetical protein